LTSSCAALWRCFECSSTPRSISPPPHLCCDCFPGVRGALRRPPSGPRRHSAPLPNRGTPTNAFLKRLRRRFSRPSRSLRRRNQSRCACRRARRQ
jgi:hypothetical protein